MFFGNWEIPERSDKSMELARYGRHIGSLGWSDEGAKPQVFMQKEKSSAHQSLLMRIRFFGRK